MSFNYSDLPSPLDTRGDWWPWIPPPVGYKLSTAISGSLPSVTIVIPSYNCGAYIEETIRSILLQAYPKLQLIVVDGASEDETLSVLDHYRNWLDIVISEPDHGQADAINKGLRLGDGEYFNWINADDLLSPFSLLRLFGACEDSPDIIAASVGNFKGDNPFVFDEVKNFGFSAQNFILGPSSDICFHQPGVWVKRRLFEEVGFFSDDMRYVFDSEMMIRLLARPRYVVYRDFVTSFFRLRQGSKTVSESASLLKEDHFMPIRIFDNPTLLSLHGLQARALLDRGWNAYISSLYKNPRSCSSLAKLFCFILFDPVHRLNRYSLGAARHHLAKLFRFWK